MRRNGVINRKDLDELQPGALTPIGQGFEVGELPHAKARLTPQTENRYGNSCALPQSRRERGKTVIQNGLFSPCNNVIQYAVGSVLVANERIVLHIIHAILIRNRKRFPGQVQFRPKKTVAGFSIQ